jgi:hypothetical protein
MYLNFSADFALVQKAVRIPRRTEPECDLHGAGQRPKRAANYDNIPPARPHQGNSSSTRAPQKRVTAEHAARRRTKRRIGDRTHNLGFGSAYHTIEDRVLFHPSKPKNIQHHSLGRRDHHRRQREGHGRTVSNRDDDLGRLRCATGDRAADRRKV